MKSNENGNIPYCGKYLSVSSGWCGVAGIVSKGKNIRELGYLKGSVVEPYKVSLYPFVEWCYSSLVECGLCSWWENADTWFSITTACRPNHVV